MSADVRRDVAPRDGAYEAAQGPGGGRSGRRPGEGNTRETILGAARAAFAALGYDRASIRGIAAEARVDPALVLHYFGSKEELFVAALELPIQPGAVFARALAAGQDQLGSTVVRAFLEAWEPPETRVRLMAMLRSAMTNEAAMKMIRDLLMRQVFGPITELLDVPDAQLRATLVGSQFIGLGMMRYVSRVEPLASASIDDLALAVGPTVQRYLTGDIGQPGHARG